MQSLFLALALVGQAPEPANPALQGAIQTPVQSTPIQSTGQPATMMGAPTKGQPTAYPSGQSVTYSSPQGTSSWSTGQSQSWQSQSWSTGAPVAYGPSPNVSYQYESFQASAAPCPTGNCGAAYSYNSVQYNGPAPAYGGNVKKAKFKFFRGGGARVARAGGGCCR